MKTTGQSQAPADRLWHGVPASFTVTDPRIGSIVLSLPPRHFHRMKCLILNCTCMVLETAKLTGRVINEPSAPAATTTVFYLRFPR